jgi:hypothetical protein
MGRETDASAASATLRMQQILARGFMVKLNRTDSIVEGVEKQFKKKLARFSSMPYL